MDCLNSLWLKAGCLKKGTAFPEKINKAQINRLKNQSLS